MKRLYNYLRCQLEVFENIVEVAISDSGITLYFHNTGEVIMWYKDNLKNAYHFIMGVIRALEKDNFNEWY